MLHFIQIYMDDKVIVGLKCRSLTLNMTVGVKEIFISLQTIKVLAKTIHESYKAAS